MPILHLFMYLLTKSMGLATVPFMVLILSNFNFIWRRILLLGLSIFSAFLIILPKIHITRHLLTIPTKKILPNKHRKYALFSIIDVIFSILTLKHDIHLSNIKNLLVRYVLTSLLLVADSRKH